MRIAAIADLHCRIDSRGMVQDLLKNVENEADVLVLAGDLTDTGLPAEMDVLLDELKPFTLPIVTVLGNHDHESDQAETLAEMLTGRENIRVLQGNVFEIDGVGFIGTKGFCGGFGSTFVQPFGERALKEFIQISIDEAVTLENAAAKLSCEHKIAVLHYAPIPETLQGESEQLFAFLGSSRLANALDRQGVDVIFHGHAHHGAPEGRTPGNIPVHNVSRFVPLAYSDRAYCLFEV